MTRSSISGDDNPGDVVNLEETGPFATDDKQDSWIKYDFKNQLKIERIENIDSDDNILKAQF